MFWEDGEMLIILLTDIEGLPRSTHCALFPRINNRNNQINQNNYYTRERKNWSWEDEPNIKNYKLTSWVSLKLFH